MLEQYRLSWRWALAAVASIVCMHPIHESDPFWHMTLGRAVLAHGARVFPEPTAFEAFTTPAVVPEWLWAVVNYGIYELAGPTGLVLFVMPLAAACVWAVAWMLRSVEPETGESALALVTTLIIVVMASRLRLRPQLLFLLILPCFIAMTHHYVVSEGRERLRWGLGLIGLEVVWAQVHGSFVIGPAIFGVTLLSHLRSFAEPEHRRAHLAMGLGLLLAFTTNAYGLGVVHYVLVHAGGDAARHVADMLSLEWHHLLTTAGPFRLSYILLWQLAIGAAVYARRFDLAHIGLALLGLAMMLNSVRFSAAGAVLIGPLAIAGADVLARALPRSPAKTLIGAGAACGLLIWTVVFVNSAFGPIGGFGFAEGKHPKAAAVWLQRLPQGSAVLAGPAASGVLGFRSEGRYRTYVDMRTPLYFDDTDFGVAREIYGYAEALDRAVQRYELDAIVVSRASDLCGQLPEGWRPVVVEARYSTFSPVAEADSLQTVAACGFDFLAADACRDGATQLDREIDELASLDDSPFVAYLRAERILRCGGEVAAAERNMPSTGEAWEYRPQRDLTRARLAVAKGEKESARALLLELASRGDGRILPHALALMQAGGMSLEEARGILEKLAFELDDQAPVPLRAELAMVCIRLGDPDCARFHGSRAAVRGSELSRTIWGWLAEHHPEERVRRDSTAWLSTLPPPPLARNEP